jgi:hypothetical protein
MLDNPVSNIIKASFFRVGPIIQWKYVEEKCVHWQSKLNFLFTSKFLLLEKRISWYRWQEAFRLDGFQVYGTFLTAVALRIGVVYWVKRSNMKNVQGQSIVFVSKKKSLIRYLAGGILFGTGWALVGCPGAQYALLGHGFFSVLIVPISAVFGTFVYGLVRNHLPH